MFNISVFIKRWFYHESDFTFEILPACIGKDTLGGVL